MAKRRVSKPPSPKPWRSVYIYCPKCGRRVCEALPTVAEYYDPKFHCQCGYKKPLYWRRNEY